MPTIVRLLAAGDDPLVRSIRPALVTVIAGPPGHGLVGMRERARLAGGEFASRVEAGEFVVVAVLPTGEGVSA